MYLTHLEQDIDIDANDLIEEFSKDQITSSWPFIELNKGQLFQEDLRGRRTSMTRSEKKFAKYLMNNDFIVYHEPLLESCPRIPDFLICRRGLFNDITQLSIVEITDMSINQQNCDRRKHNQVLELNDVCTEFKIPFKALFREDLEILYNSNPVDYFNF